MTYQQGKEFVFNAMTYLDCKTSSLVVLSSKRFINMLLGLLLNTHKLTSAEQYVSALTSQTFISWNVLLDNIFRCCL